MENLAQNFGNLPRDPGTDCMAPCAALKAVRVSRVTARQSSEETRLTNEKREIVIPVYTTWRIISI